MRAVAVDEFGGPDKMSVRRLPIAMPGPGQVQIKVAYASVNPADWKLREGWARRAADFVPSFPFVLGIDAAGTVSAVGDPATGVQVGDRVVAWANNRFGLWGSYADYVVVGAESVARVPDDLNLRDASTVPTAGLTAWQNLFLADRANISAGDTVLVNGAAGGVGSYAVQLAHHAGSLVAATCGPSNLDYVRSLGADHVIDYRTEDVHDALRRWQPSGVDAVIDAILDPPLARALDMLKPGGMWVRIGALSDVDDDHPSEQELADRGLRAVLTHRDRTQLDGQMDQILGQLARGDIRAPEIQEFALADVAEAHRLVQGGHVRGKVVLRVNG